MALPRRTIALLAVAGLALTTVSVAAPSAGAAPSKPPSPKRHAATGAHPYLERALVERGDAGAANSFVAERIALDKSQTAHVRVQQTYHGIPVFGGEAIAHLTPDGALGSLTNNFARAVVVRGGVRASVSSTRAVRLAAASARLAPSGVSVPQAPQLVVFPRSGDDALAWRVRLVHTEDTDTPSIPVVFVDAKTGATVWSYDDLQTDTGHSHYSGDVTLNTTLSGGVYQLKDPTRGNNTVTNLNRATSGSGTLFTSADQDWGDGTATASTSGAAGETAGVDAAYGAAETWDYYLNVLGRNGIFNNGTGVPSRVHYGTGYNNAFWDGTQMTYGDGTGNTNPLTAIDVGGHEMSHGVTENTAGLVYSGESGGLNEATSDIFGTAVEWYANNPADPPDYLIGEKINVNGDGTPLRYMDKPSKDGGSKDCWYSGIGNLDVHYSSGPANHFYYLASEGSGAKTINGVSYNSPTCNGGTVTGIGHLKVEKIWYRALTTYFTSSTTYAAARNATLSAASDLYGAGSAEYTTVCNAWAGVSVGTACTGSTFALSNGVPASNLSGAAGASLNYSLSVPSGATNLSFTLSGGTGDANLYVRFGSAPTTSTYDCASTQAGNAETCSFATPGSGTYYVLVYGNTSFSGASLVGSYTAGSTGLQNGVPVSVPATSTGGTQNYTMAVPSGASNLKFVMSGGTGDADLYVKFGSAPTTSVYDCRPYLSGNSETCSFATPSVGTYYVMVRAYASFSSVTLTGSYATGGGGGNVLSNGVPVNVPATSVGGAQNYTMAVPSGAANLKFVISGGTGDADLYVKFGSAPTTTTYDCRPYLTGNSETCSFATPSVGTYYVMVRAYASYSGVTLTGSFTTGGGGNVLSNAVPVSVPATSTGGAVNYTMSVPSGRTTLSFKISGGTGDADLYVKFGSAPTTTSYDCRPYLSGTTETCSFSAPASGTWYVMVRAYATFSGVSLVGTYS